MGERAKRDLRAARRSHTPTTRLQKNFGVVARLFCAAAAAAARFLLFWSAARGRERTRLHALVQQQQSSGGDNRFWKLFIGERADKFGRFTAPINSKLALCCDRRI